MCWLTYLTNAFAAVSLLQMNTWHSKTLIPVVLLRMAAKSGGWLALGFRAKGLSRGRKRWTAPSPELALPPPAFASKVCVTTHTLHFQKCRKKRGRKQSNIRKA